jgi:hypothetical protein
MVFHNQNYWVFGCFSASGILGNKKHDVSETGSVSVLWFVGKTPKRRVYPGSILIVQSKNPVNLIVIHHRHNRSESTCRTGMDPIYTLPLGVFPPKTQDGNRSSFRNFVFSLS